MAWPFSNVVAPNFDTGPGVSVPTVADTLSSDPVWILGMDFTNTNAPGGQSVTVQLTNGAGALLAEKTIPPGGEWPKEPPFRPAIGLKWVADHPGAVGHIWGYA